MTNSYSSNKPNNNNNNNARLKNINQLLKNITLVEESTLSNNGEPMVANYYKRGDKPNKNKQIIIFYGKKAK